MRLRAIRVTRGEPHRQPAWMWVRVGWSGAAPLLITVCRDAIRMVRHTMCRLASEPTARPLRGPSMSGVWASTFGVDQSPSVALSRHRSPSVAIRRHRAHNQPAPTCLRRRSVGGQIRNADSEDSQGIRIGMMSVGYVSGSSNETTVVCKSPFFVLSPKQRTARFAP